MNSPITGCRINWHCIDSKGAVLLSMPITVRLQADGLLEPELAVYINWFRISSVKPTRGIKAWCNSRKDRNDEENKQQTKDKNSIHFYVYFYAFCWTAQMPIWASNFQCFCSFSKPAPTQPKNTPLAIFQHCIFRVLAVFRVSQFSKGTTHEKVETLIYIAFGFFESAMYRQFRRWHG